jgi:dTDP-glucose 4,6-dehydratase
MIYFIATNRKGVIMRVLLTGAGGFVGHHTLSHLLKTTDHHFIVTDSFRHRGNSARLRSVFEEVKSATDRVKVITHDLTTPIDLVTSREFGDIQVLISMASESHVDRSIEEPRNFIENNTNLILTLLEYTRQLDNFELFLQISTDEVYGPAPGGILHKEWDPYFPSNPYSASKAAQESICYSYWRTFGIPMILTNTMNIVGERQDTEKFIPMVISNLIKNKPIPVHAKKDGDRWISGSRYYLHARNQADALCHLIQNREKLTLNYTDDSSILEKFHVVGEKEVSNEEMVNLLAKFIGTPPKIEFTDFHSSRPGHDLRYALDGEKLKNFGWVPPVPLEQSLQKTVNWYLNNKNWLT